MTSIHRHLVVTLVLSLVAGVAGAATPLEPLPEVRVGIVTDGPLLREHTFLNILKEEMVRTAEGSYSVVFPDDATVNGNWEADGISQALDGVLGRTDLDVVVALGIGAAAEVCTRQEFPTPVVVPFYFPNLAEGCPQQSVFRSRSMDMREIIARDLRAFRQIVPFSRIAFLLDPAWPTESDFDVLEDDPVLRGITVDLVAINPNQTDVKDRLDPATDAVYLLPMFQMDDSQFKNLVADLTDRGLPTFSMLGEQELELGVFAGVNTQAAMTAIARSTALDLIDIHTGRTIAGSEQFELGGKLTLNMETAENLGFDPSWELLTRARLVHHERFWRDRPINLESAIRRAVHANLDLAVNERRVAAGAEDMRSARAEYRPRLEVGLNGAMIDENHALGALGQYAKSASGSLTLTQLIYSDAASANIDIQKNLHRARQLDAEGLRLDIARDAVAAFMNVMRTNALIQVRQEQVDLTGTNLDLARLRHTLGTSGAAEVHRWEAELATVRAGLLQALSQHRQSERQLSRLLDEDLTTRWSIREMTLDEALAVLGGIEDINRLGGATGYRELAASLMNESTEGAPELAALQTMIDAQERLLQSTERANYLPTVGLQANLSHVLAKDETGGLDLGDFADLIPAFDDTSWNVGVQAKLPVLTGGKNQAQETQAREELHALRIDHKNAEGKVSQRALSALDTAIASWSSIDLRQQAANAADKTLDLVRDAYVRGAASILDVLDAQNSAINADLAAKTAVYDFLDDWAEVRRSVADLGPTTRS